MIYDQPPAPIVVCLDCSPHERIALNFLQEKRKIRNINALAVVMGNIKQESRFDHLVCEGGQRTGYKKCNSGGFGLIQWTTTARYIGLGKFCAKYDLNPDHFMTQLRYMVNENQWVRYEPYLLSPGQSVDYYMRHAYNWLGWGVHGNRTDYAHNYVSRFSVVVPDHELYTIG